MPSQEQADKRDKYLNPEYSKRVAERYVENVRNNRVALGGKDPKFSKNPANPRNSKISKTTFYEMLAVAIFFDLISLIPIAGTICDVVALLVFYIWYKMLGISFSNPKRAGSFLGTALIEAIPLLDMLPTWTIEIIYMYTLENADILLEKVGSVTGNAAAVTAVAGKAAKFAGAKNVGNKLEETSKKAEELKYKIEISKQKIPNKIEDIKGPKNQTNKEINQKDEKEAPHNPEYIFGKPQEDSHARPFNQDRIVNR